MYKYENATFEEFEKLCNNCFEGALSPEENYEGYLFNKFTFDDEPLIIGGRVVVEDLKTHEEQFYMCFAVSKNIIKHKRAMLIAGKDYFNYMSACLPLRVIIEHDNNVFKKFAEHFGFKQTNFVEKNEESGIIYDVYIRR